MEPKGQVGSALVGGVVGASVGPFTQAGLNEAFGLAVSPWRIAFGEDVLEAELLARFREGSGAVARTIVGHDALDLDAQAGIVGNGGLEEGNGAFFSSFITRLKAMREASSMQTWTNAEVTVDHTGSPPGDTMPHRTDFAELFDVDMDELAGPITLIAADR
jgi:hypothetical protein